MAVWPSATLLARPRSAYGQERTSTGRQSPMNADLRRLDAGATDLTACSLRRLPYWASKYDVVSVIRSRTILLYFSIRNILITILPAI